MSSRTKMEPYPHRHSDEDGCTVCLNSPAVAPRPTHPDADRVELEELRLAYTILGRAIRRREAT